MSKITVELEKMARSAPIVDITEVADCVVPVLKMAGRLNRDGHISYEDSWLLRKTVNMMRQLHRENTQMRALLKELNDG